MNPFQHTINAICYKAWLVSIWKLAMGETPDDHLPEALMLDGGTNLLAVPWAIILAMHHEGDVALCVFQQVVTEVPGIDRVPTQVALVVPGDNYEVEVGEVL